MFVSPFRDSKPKNRPSFQQVLLHVEIAAGDVLKTPQEIYLNQQVSRPSTATESTNSLCLDASVSDFTYTTLFGSPAQFKAVA